jgi:hypothetical protein
MLIVTSEIKEVLCIPQLFEVDENNLWMMNFIEKRSSRPFI